MNILKQSTLVLNKHWIPINTVTVKEAITMLCGEWRDENGKIRPKAEILDHLSWQRYDWNSWSELRPQANEMIIRSGRGEHRVPEIIIVTHYTKIPKNQLNFNKRNLFRRDGDTCQYCGCKPGTENLTVEHVIPRSKGGKNNWENCVAACIECNQKKRDLTPKQAGMSLLRQPCKPGLEILGQVGRKKSWEIFFGKPSIDDVISEAYWTVPLE